MLANGTILSDRYEIVEKIGSGGMAIVFRGKDRKLERYVTIKVLREDFIGDEDFISRFKSEACSAARLSHPNIVRVYDVGEDEDVYYIVMEYIHGDTLKKAIKEKAPFDTKSTINVVIQMASAISHAHKNHIIHRDIKPQNILVGTDGIVKVTDFGIARAATESTMTATANAIGSVHYFSPEQARGGYVDEKSDIYSLGITMFEMVTGQLPFQGNNSVAIALKHINDELPDIRQYNPNVSKSLEGIIRKATRKKADERYANIDLLLADLIRARTDSSGVFIKEHDFAEKVATAGIAAGIAAGMSSMKVAEAAEKGPKDIADEVKPQPQKTLEFLENSHSKPNEVTDSVSEDTILPINAKRMTELPESGVGFDKYNKKLKISKDDEFEKEYEEAHPLKKSRPPKKSEKQRRNPRLNEKYEGDYDKRQEKKVVIAAVITALIIIAGISAAGIHMFGGLGSFFSFSQTGDIEVPSFEGESFESAEAMARDLGLKVVKEGEDYSKYYSTNIVISQTIPPGNKVKKGTDIGVKVSLGLSSEEMPDVVDKSERAATAKITDLVGADVKVEYVFSNAAKVGYVMAQTPSKGSKINAKSRIILTVSKGEESRNVSVPKVEGYTEAQAKRELEASGLVVGNITTAESAKVAKGVVITQTLSAGQEVPSNSVVGLVVSSGPSSSTGDSETVEKEPNKPTKPSAPVPSESVETSVRMFNVSAPANSGESVRVKVIKVDNNGSATTVMDENRGASEFPFPVSVTGSGKGQVQCYIDGVRQWSENVNFSEGGN